MCLFTRFSCNLQDGASERDISAPVPTFRVAGEGERFGFRDVRDQRKSSPHYGGGGEEEGSDEYGGAHADDDQAGVDGDPDADEDSNDRNGDLPRHSERAEGTDRHDDDHERLYFPRSSPPAAGDNRKKGMCSSS